MNTSIYAKPVAPRIILRPVLATLVLHGFMVYLLTVNWSASSTEAIRVKPAPQVINARLVDVSEFQPRKAAVKQPVKKTATQKPTPAAKPAPEKPAVKKPPVQKTVVPAKPANEAKAQAEKITSQELAAIARSELSRAIAEEDQSAAAATATAQELTASFAAMIQQTVVSYWSRPPSARNGMEVLLSLQLVPTGEVISVSIIDSSGNTAFDRSAVNAVEKAGAFPELQNLPSGEFEKTFRRFRLLFKPEDLRY